MPNTVLTTRGNFGDLVRTEWDITELQYDLTMLSSESVLRGTRGTRPIRLQEQTLKLQFIFSLAQEQSFIRFRSVLLMHWRWALNRGVSEPMTLYYHPFRRSWRGFLESIPLGYEVPQTSFHVDTTLKIVNPKTFHKSTVVTTSPMIPTNRSVSLAGWWQYEPRVGNENKNHWKNVDAAEDD